MVEINRDSFIGATGEDLDCLQLSTECDGVGYVAVDDTEEDEITVSLDIKGFTLKCYSMTKKELFEENERLKSQLKEQEAIRKLAEGCIYDIEDALYRGDKNDRASEAIDEFEEKVKEWTLREKTNEET